jgi:CheY-like chemotaxis protein
MVVDNNAESLARTLQMLRNEGHWAAGVESAEGALNRFLEGAFDELLTGVLLPGLPGTILAQKLHERAELPVIYLGAPALNEPSSWVFVLCTPYSTNELQAALARAAAAQEHFEVAATTGAGTPVRDAPQPSAPIGATSTTAWRPSVAPVIVGAFVIVGGQYGRGALRVNGRTEAYYSTRSLGFQAGAQSKAVIYLFTTQQALNKFRSSEGWTVGADATVALATIGANGSVDTQTLQQPVVGFMLTNVGLEAGVSLQGAKIDRIRT